MNNNFLLKSKNSKFFDLFINDLFSSKNFTDYKSAIEPFYSQYEIKLKERYDFLFYLKKYDELDKSFSKFLPHPEPKNLNFDKTKNIFFNDLFITLD